MQSEKSSENENIRKVYSKIIWLAVFLHSSQIIIFSILKCPLAVCYNIGSVFFYFAMLKLVTKGMLRLAVASIHIEVCLFVSVSTYLCGWDMGTPLYLLAMASLIYFCPWENKYIPYLISVGEFFVYLVLLFYSRKYKPFYSIKPEFAALYHLYSAVAGFSIILVAAFLSNLSATVNRKMLQEENKSLEKIANYDYLTSLMSRQFFLKELERYPKNLPVAMALGDIDNFKMINDTHGHAAGDYVLHAVAQIFLRFASLSTLTCRWGGEEFVFFFPGCSREKVKEELELIKNEVEKASIVFNGKKIHVTMTIGVFFENNTENFLSMIENADSLMYQGKQSGKNKIISGR